MVQRDGLLTIVTYLYMHIFCMFSQDFALAPSPPLPRSLA